MSPCESNADNRRMKNFFKTLWRSVYPILIYLLISFVVMIVFETAQSIAVYLTTGTIDVVGLMDSMMNNALLETLIAAVLTVPVAILLMHNDDKLYGVEKKEMSIWLKLLMIVVIIGVAIGGNWIINLTDVGSLDPVFMETSEAISDAPVAIQILTAVVFGPLVEELIFRGLCFRRMEKSWGMIWALLLSSLFFGIFHGNFVQAAYAFVLGIILGLGYYNSGSIVFTFIMHALANLAPLLLFV